MKKSTKILILSIALVITFASSYLIWDRYQQTQSIIEPIQKLQPISLTNLNGDPYQLSPTDSMTRVIVEFHPGCDYCEHYCKQLVERSADLNHLKFVMVTSSSSSEVRQFMMDFEFPIDQNFEFYLDPEYNMDFFPTIVSPSTYVYNAEGELIFYQMGYRPLNDIIDQFSE